MKSRTSQKQGGDEPELHNLIQERAYALYLERGQLPGFEFEDWLRAEQEISGNHRRKTKSAKR